MKIFYVDFSNSNFTKNGIFERPYIKNLALLSKLWHKLYQLYDFINVIISNNVKL